MCVRAKNMAKSYLSVKTVEKFAGACYDSAMKTIAINLGLPPAFHMAGRSVNRTPMKHLKRTMGDTEIFLVTDGTLYLAKNGVKVLLANERSELHFLVPNTPMELHRSDWKYVSVFPLEGQLTGLAIRGAFYPLENAKLTADYPLGVSNEFVAETAHLQCSGGTGVVVLTRDDA